jgi:hypothetical protein
VDGQRAKHERRRRPSAGMVLAAVDRAGRHRLPQAGPAPWWALLEHLALRPRSGAARQVRLRVVELERAGLIERLREHGIPVWSVTPAGRRRLAAETDVRLPESPRHRAWRHARVLAARELPRFRERLAAALAESGRMLAPATARPGADDEDGAGAAPSSQEWLRAGRALHADCRRLASAWHCLHEWEEPSDDEPAAPAADARETAHRAELAALRNVRLWREPDC